MRKIVVFKMKENRVFIENIILTDILILFWRFFIDFVYKKDQILYDNIDIDKHIICFLFVLEKLIQTDTSSTDNCADYFFRLLF